MPTTDNRIVQMTFKNEQFERGVKESLHSLEELKKALDLDKSAESLSNLEKIAGSFDISGIANGIDSIADRFTLLGNIGQEAFRRISSFALDEVHKITNAITSMPRAGMTKYEEKNQAVQMIRSAMPDKSIEEVEAVLAKLNEYTDLTSYDFSNMAKSIGKFVSAGVDLETAERVMEGIANETASAGGDIQQANIAMYNFSQALAAGSVKLLDWRSIMNQNLDTKEFKEEIIKAAIAMGTLGKVSDTTGYYIKGTGKKAHKVMVDFKSFADTLSDGWFTSDVMLKVFDKYADRESDVGKKGFEAAKIAITLKQALDAVKDAISTGWMTSFEYLFGNLDEAGELFTRISDSLIDFTSQISETRNELLKGWHDGGEDGISGYQKVIEGLSNSWGVLMSIVESAKGAFKTVFGELDSTGLIEASKAFSEFTDKVKAFFGYTEETITKTRKIKKEIDPMPTWYHELKKGMKGDEIKRLQEQLLKLGYAEVQLDKYGADGIFGPETQAALKAFQKKVGLAQTGIYDKATRDKLGEKLWPGKYYTEELQTDTKVIRKLGKGATLLKGAFEGFAAVGKLVLGVMRTGIQIAGKIISVFKPIGKGALWLAYGLGKLVSLIVDFISALNIGDTVLSTFSAVISPIAKLFEKIGYFMSVFGDGLADIVKVVRGGVGSFEELGEKLKLNPKLKNGKMLYDILVKLKTAADKAAPVFNTLKTMISNAFNAVKNWISGKVSAGLSAIGTFFSNLWTTIQEGDYLTKILTGIGTALQIVLGIVGGAAYGIYSLAKAIAEGGIALFEFVKNSEFVQNALSKLSDFFRPVKEFFTSVWESMTSLSGKLGELKSFSEIWQSFITSMRENPIGQKFAPALEKVGGIIQGARDKVALFFATVKSVFSLLKTYKSPEKALQAILMTSKGGYDMSKSPVVKMLRFLLRMKKVFIGILPVITKVKNTVKGVAQSIGKSIRDFFGGDGVSPGEKITTAFEDIKGRLSTAFRNLSTWVGDLIGNSPFLQKLAEFGRLVGNAISEFFTSDTSGISSIPGKLLERLKAFDPVIQWVKDKFNSIKEFLMDPNKLLSHVVGALKGIGEFVIGIFKNVNLGTIWDVAKSALGTYIMLSFAKSLKNFTRSVGVLTGAIDKDEKEGLADKLRHIAVTIAIVTAALAALAFIPADKAIAGVGVMAAALVVIVGAIVALNKWAPKTDDIGKGLLSMALSLVAVIVAIAAAAMLINAGGDLTKPLLLVGGIMAALGVVAWAMNKFGKNKKSGSKGQAKTILAMCAGLYLIVKAVDKMAKVLKGNKGHEGLIIQSLIVVGVMLAALGAVAVLMSKHGRDAKGESTTGVASAILAMCTGLSSIVSAVGKMADVMKRYPDHFGGAYAMIMGLLAVIGGIAVALAIFSKDLDWKVSLASAAPIVAMGYFLDKVVNAMADGIQKVSGVDPKIIEQFLIGVAEAVIAMVATVAIFSKIGLAGLAEAAAGIVLILGAIGLGLDIAATFTADAVNKLASAMWQVGSKLNGFDALVKDIDDNKISSAMDVLTKTVIPAIAQMVQYSSTIIAGVGAATNIWLFGEALSLFQGAISGITVDTGTAIRKLPEDIKATVDGINAIEGIDAAKSVLTDLGGALALYYGNLATAMQGEAPTDDVGNFDINKANEAFNHLADLTLDDETVKKIQSYATGGEHDLNSFAIGIENLGQALKDYGDKINDIDPTKVETANEILDKVKDIDDHINPMAQVNYDVLNGKRKSISSFGLDIAALGRSLAAYGDRVSTLNPGKILMANVVLDAIADLNRKLPETGGLLQILIGEKKLGEFASNMKSLGDGLAQYATAVSGADFTNVSESATAVEGLARAQSILQRNGGLSSLVAGTAGLDSLGTNLVGLGKSMVQFAHDQEGIKNLKDADFDQIGKAIEPIKKLAEAQSILQREGGFKDKVEGSSNLGNLGTGLESFGLSLITFNAYAQKFDATDEHLLNAMDILERIVAMQAIVQNGDAEYDFVNVGRGFQSLIDFINDTLKPEGDSSMIENASNNLTRLFTALAKGMNEEEPKAIMVQAVESITASIQTVIDTNTITPAYTWGLDLVKNFSNGITENTDLVTAAVEAVAGIVWSYLHFSKPEVGPLKDFDTYGGDMMDLFGEGITGNVDVVRQAVSTASSQISDAYGEAGSNAIDAFLGAYTSSGADSIAGRAKDGVMGVLGSLKDSLLGVGEDNPVITPVVDLTNVSDAQNQIDGMLNGKSVSVGASLAQNVASGNGVTIIQGGAAEDHSKEIIDSINDLSTRITDMARQMQNLKVVMNTNALVGQLVGPMDVALGRRSYRR